MFGKIKNDDMQIIAIGDETISLPRRDYEDLLITKGKYLQLKHQQSELVDILIDKLDKGKVSVNNIRAIFGFKEFNSLDKQKSQNSH